MRIIRYGTMTLSILLGVASPALARVNIDINLSLFPELERVPGYPVYYAPRMDLNFFFYDGMYWLYEDDDWYTSNWYNGPWEYVDPEFVPVYVLRIPVRYYRRPPPYFHGWRAEEPPHWSHRWGEDWQRHHSGWEHWDRQHSPTPAPLPNYQRHYSGDRYPREEEQREIRDRNYHYQPQTPEVRKREQNTSEKMHVPEQRNKQGEYQQQNTERHSASPKDDRERYSPPTSRGESTPEPGRKHEKDRDNDRVQEEGRGRERDK